MTSPLMMYEISLWWQITKGEEKNLAGDWHPLATSLPALEQVGRVMRSGSFSIWKMLIHKGPREQLASGARLYKIEHHPHAGSISRQWF